MPWTTKADVARHNRKASNNPAMAKKWRAVANAVLARTGDDAKAIKIASFAIKRKPS